MCLALCIMSKPGIYSFRRACCFEAWALSDVLLQAVRVPSVQNWLKILFFIFDSLFLLGLFF